MLMFIFQATVLCDIIVMYFLKRGAFYKSKKYKDVVDDDAFQVHAVNTLLTLYLISINYL